MNTYELISSVVDSLAWPFSILVIILILKAPINKLFSNISKVKYNELEMDFSKVLEIVDENLNENEDAPPTRRLIEKDPELYQIATSNPEAAVLISFKKIEDEIFDTIIRLGLRVENDSIYSTKQYINSLIQNGYLDVETTSSLNELRLLRNMAAQNSATITPEAARYYYDLSLRVINKLQQLS